MSCAQIRERALEIVSSKGVGVQGSEIVKQIASESPVTPRTTISTQVYQAIQQIEGRNESVGSLYRSNACSSNSSYNPEYQGGVHQGLIELSRLGFVPIGCFDYDGPHVRKNLILHPDRSPALYAFVIDEAVVYIGKTAMTLAKRLYFYARPGTSQITNIRNNGSIRQALDAGKQVEIWALVDWEPVEHRGIPINVAAGIEDALIERLKPEWNAR